MQQQQQQQGHPGLAILSQLGQAGLMQDPMEQMKGIMGLFAAMNQIENSDATLALNQQEADNRNTYNMGMLGINQQAVKDPEADAAMRRAYMMTQLLQSGMNFKNMGAVGNIFTQAGMPGLWDPQQQQGGMPSGMGQEEFQLRQDQINYNQRPRF